MKNNMMGLIFGLSLFAGAGVYAVEQERFVVVQDLLGYRAHIRWHPGMTIVDAKWQFMAMHDADPANQDILYNGDVNNYGIIKHGHPCDDDRLIVANETVTPDQINALQVGHMDKFYLLPNQVIQRQLARNQNR